MTTRSIALVMFVLLASTPVAAQPGNDKPWAAGVSEDEQRVALELYEQGNAEFQAARFAQAVAKYAEALRHWDHPAIHFNMAVSLINLDQPLEAKDHLERALKYGEEPLGHDMYMQGLTYRHSLDGQIARIRVSCSEPDTTITLDGTFLFTAPGEIERMVLPGRHQVVGIKPGFITATETLDLAPARLTKYDVHLVALKPTTRIVQRWPAWQPWAVGSSGIVLAGIGGIAYVFAKHNFDQYDAGIIARCPRGCDAATASSFTDLNDAKHRGKVEQDVAFSLFGVGGAVVLAGAIGVVLNLPHSVVERPAVVVVPTPGGAAVSFGSRW